MYIHYFATLEDRLSILQRIEERIPINYVLTGNFLSSEQRMNELEYNSIKEIEISENIGSKQLSTSESYLITLKDIMINTDNFYDTNSKKRFAIYEGNNPESIEYTRSGIYQNEIFVHGRFATLNASEVAKKIFLEIKKLIKMDFKHIKSFYLGKNATVAFNNGKRFAGASVDSPIEFDLKI
jgi:hypothetical protein